MPTKTRQADILKQFLMEAATLAAIGGVIDAIDVTGGVVSITPLPGMLDESK